VLLFVLAFHRLPKFTNVSSRKVRIRDAMLALSAGAMMTALLLLVTGHFGQAPISDYYARESYNLAHGRNVVNVILVDFRALDTLGEATVLAVAAIGAYALVKLVVGKGGGE
jgi:multicomponent Na+:H+ antiporter subunit A